MIWISSTRHVKKHYHHRWAWKGTYLADLCIFHRIEPRKQVALKLARLLSAAHKTVHSVIRNESQSEEIREAGAQPVVLSLEDDDVQKFTKQFVDSAADVVYFSAGAGGKGGAERTRKVDYEGALKIFDAIERVEKSGGKKNPRLILVSAIDIRNPDKVPEHYVSGLLDNIHKPHHNCVERAGYQGI